MGKYDKVSRMLEDEIDKIGMSGKLTTSSLEVGDKAAHFLKSIKTIEAMDEAEGNSYNYDGMSYARGRRYAKRDAMGKYTSDRGMMHDYNRNYSGNKHELMMELEELKDKVESMED